MTSVAAEARRPVWQLTAVRLRLGLVGLLVALAIVAWWWTAREMRGMDGGPWTSLGGFGWFVGVWVVMMAAMMFPSVAPTVALYSRMTERRSPLPGLVFAGGYLSDVGARRARRLRRRGRRRQLRRRRPPLGSRRPLGRGSDAARRRRSTS